MGGVPSIQINKEDNDEKILSILKHNDHNIKTILEKHDKKSGDRLKDLYEKSYLGEFKLSILSAQGKLGRPRKNERLDQPDDDPFKYATNVIANILRKDPKMKEFIRNSAIDSMNQLFYNYNILITS